MGNCSPGHSLNKDFQVQKLAKGIQLVRGRDRIRTQASLQEPSSLKTTGGLGAWEEPNPTLQREDLRGGYPELGGGDTRFPAVFQMVAVTKI